MIHEKDLRIGNFVIYDNEVTEIHSISDGCNDGSDNNDNGFNLRIVELHGGEGTLVMWQDLGSLKGIPLTPELLIEKCGFKMVGGTAFFTAGIFDLKYIDGILYLDVEGQNLKLPVNFLHELQNVFYCLSKKELIINL